MIQLPNGRHYLGRKPDRHDERDYDLRRVAPHVDRTQIMPSFDMHENITVRYDQSTLGSCTANTGAALLNYWFPSVEVSRLDIYYRSRAREGTINQDAGAETRDMMRELCVGAYDETIFPYDIARFRQYPPEQPRPWKLSSYARLTTADDILRALCSGYPFALGFSVPEYFGDIGGHGVMWMPDSRTQFCGGHDVLSIGYSVNFHEHPDFIASGLDAAKVPGEAILCLNSWGTVFGCKGEHAGCVWLPLPFVIDRNRGADCWVGVK